MSQGAFSLNDLDDAPKRQGAFTLDDLESPAPSSAPETATQRKQRLTATDANLKKSRASLSSPDQDEAGSLTEFGERLSDTDKILEGRRKDLRPDDATGIADFNKLVKARNDACQDSLEMSPFLTP